MRITFDPKRKEILTSRWRKKMLPPYEVLKKLGIKSNDIVADIGCGPGYFTIPASEYLDNTKIYALDISEDMLNHLKSINQSEKIVAVKTEPYNLKLPNKTVTFALLVSVIHEIDNLDKFIGEINRILKVNGRFAIIEWQKTKLDLGPAFQHKFSPEEIIEICHKQFKHIKTIDFNEYFYGCIFEKSD